MNLPQLTFHLKVNAHYKTAAEDLFDEMYEIARQLNTPVSAAHSYQNLIVTPEGTAILEVPWGEPRFRTFKRRVPDTAGSLVPGMKSFLHTWVLEKETT